MSNLSLVEAKLPPGFRFHPRDEELICDYLMKKIALCDQYPLLIEVDLNKCEPWDIPEIACVGGKEWYFYSQHDRKYTTGLRTNRATMSGYWKATGKDRQVIRRGTLVGMRKTLVFYQGRAPKGRRTEWVMNEFRLQGPSGPIKASPFKEDWVLCRVFYKNRDLSNKQDTLSLPSLVNPNYNHIIFDYHQTQTQYEQVPYFSFFNPTNCHIINQMGPTKSFKTSIEANPNITSLLNTSMYRDNKFKSEFLNHFAKVESKGSTSLGEGSSESFLSEVGGMPNNVWNNY